MSPSCKKVDELPINWREDIYADLKIISVNPKLVQLTEYTLPPVTSTQPNTSNQPLTSIPSGSTDSNPPLIMIYLFICVLFETFLTLRP